VDLRFVAPDLRKLDAVRGEALGVGIFADQRPLRGASGLVDWRLGGFLSRQLQAGRVTGAEHELTLVPTNGRLSIEKVVIVGLGLKDRFDGEVFESSCRALLDALHDARVRSSFVALPGRAEKKIGAAEAIERFVRVLAAGPEPDEITLVEGPDSQREMEPVLAREQRRARAFAP
jgi:hypothetical protein